MKNLCFFKFFHYIISIWRIEHLDCFLSIQRMVMRQEYVTKCTVSQVS